MTRGDGTRDTLDMDTTCNQEKYIQKQHAVYERDLPTGAKFKANNRKQVFMENINMARLQSPGDT